MRFNITCLFSLICLIANAQISYPPSVRVLSLQPKKQSADSAKPGINKLRLKAYQQAHDNQMPNAFQNRFQPGTLYKGNNGSGFDIYQSTLDGMVIISPDKNNKTYIPALGYPIDLNSQLATPKKIWVDSLSKQRKP